MEIQFYSHPNEITRAVVACADNCSDLGPLLLTWINSNHSMDKWYLGRFLFNGYQGIAPKKPIDDKSTLVQVMAWCRQATSHYMDQCWPRSPTPYNVTRTE